MLPNKEHFLTRLMWDRPKVDQEFHNILLGNKSKEFQVKKFNSSINQTLYQPFETYYTTTTIVQLTSLLH